MVMKLPLFILSIGAIASGYIGYKILHMVDYDLAFWNGSITSLDANNPLADAKNTEMWVKKLPLIAGLAGISLAYIFYLYVPSLPETIKTKLKPLYNFSYNKWYFDEVYNFIFVKSLRGLGNFLWKFVDVIIVDGGGPRASSKIVNYLSKTISNVQSGLVYHYAFIMLLGMFALISWFVFNFYFLTN
jgi:NADH-quinone oxidoreductase subunit L